MFPRMGLLSLGFLLGVVGVASSFDAEDDFKGDSSSSSSCEADDNDGDDAERLLQLDVALRFIIHGRFDVMG
jgi:hypothetical protein